MAALCTAALWERSQYVTEVCTAVLQSCKYVSSMQQDSHMHSSGGSDCRYSRDDDAADEQEETGWKYIHGDVFRFPRNKDVFCAVIGSGTQLLCL